MRDDAKKTVMRTSHGENKKLGATSTEHFTEIVEMKVLQPLHDAHLPWAPAWMDIVMR